MPFSREDIEKRLKQPKEGAALQRARTHETWLQAFSSPAGKSRLVEAYASFFVEDLHALIRQTFEVHSSPLLAPGTGAVYAHFHKITDTVEGRSVDYYFSRKSDEQDFSRLRKAAYPGQTPEDFYTRQVLSALLYQPNSRLVIDFPPESGEIAQPRILLVPVEDIHDLQEDATGLSLLILKKAEKKDGHATGNHTYYIYTPQDYQVWEEKSRQLRRLSVQPHPFGCCPAVSVSQLPMRPGQYVEKKSPISDSMPDLYDYNLLRNMAKFYHWQNGLPLHFGLESSHCDAIDSESGTACQGGYFLVPYEDESGEAQVRRKACPACERRKKEKMRWGNRIDLKTDHVMGNPEVVQAMYKAFGFVSTDEKLLRFNEEALQRKIEQIENDITGRSIASSHSKEALNEKHVEATLDDKRNNLSAFAAQLEHLQQWTDGFLGRVLFPESFMGCHVFYGRGFFLRSTAAMTEEYTQLAEAGADEFLLNQKAYELVLAQYRHDPLFMKAYELVCAVIPLRHVPTSELLTHATTFQADPKLYRDWLLRMNYARFMEEFMLTGRDHLLGLMQSTPAILDKVKRWFYDRTEQLIVTTNSSPQIEEDDGQKNEQSENDLTD
jgi:hypothetical protein